MAVLEWKLIITRLPSTGLTQLKDGLVQLPLQTYYNGLLPHEKHNSVSGNAAVLTKAVHLLMCFGLQVDDGGICFQKLAQVGPDGLFVGAQLGPLQNQGSIQVANHIPCSLHPPHLLQQQSSTWYKIQNSIGCTTLPQKQRSNGFLQSFCLRIKSAFSEWQLLLVVSGTNSAYSRGAYAWEPACGFMGSGLRKGLGK